MMDLIHEGKMYAYDIERTNKINYKEACEAMEEVFDDFQACKSCEHCESASDGYGTGDSPTLYECTAKSPQDCYMVEEIR